MALIPETRREAAQLAKHFLVPFNLDSESESIKNNLLLLPEPFRLVAETFLDRLIATIQTTATPFLLANAAAHNNQYQRFFMAERIRAEAEQIKVELLDEDLGGNEKALEARFNLIASKAANSKMTALSKSEDGIDTLVSETARFLINLYKGPDIQAVSRELLLQGTVSAWSALEMLVSDELVLLLNSRPDLVTKLLSAPSAKKKFELPKLNIEDLALRGFDLSKQMGFLLFGERDLSNILTLKCACEALIDDPKLREKLASPVIWLLNQNRHLIAHRRGVVDEEYLKKTGSSLKLGEQLSISPTEFEEQVRHVFGIGETFLNGLVPAIGNT